MHLGAEFSQPKERLVTRSEPKIVTSEVAPNIDPDTVSGKGVPPALETRLLAVVATARHHGIDLDAANYRARAGEAAPSPASLATWAREQGLQARTEKLRWKALFRLVGATKPPPPVILFFKDGTAGLMVGADPARNIVWIRDPRQDSNEFATAVDEFRLRQSWGGEVLLIRRLRGESEDEKPFTFGWLMGLVLKERRSLRDVGIASITMSALTILPPLLVMSVVDRVVVHQSMSTLVLLSVILAIVTVYETLLGYTRRELVQVVSTRVDARLNLTRLQPSARPAARLLREEPGRPDQLPHRPGMEGP